jgi:hypothetical protein
LATVLAVSFTLFENPDLLNLHFRQQQRIYGDENKSQISGWIIALINALVDKLGNKRTETLFSENELAQEPDQKAKVDLLAGKLDKLACCLKLSTFDEKGNYKENYFLYHIVRLNQLMLFAPLHLHVKLKIVVQDHCVNPPKFLTYHWLL